ncbi:MAG: DEAD/DEAH box helicase, partial [Dialister micraerophilus]|nr:DEAD/DEAH box helicase [Dialister micraerophilus]
MKNFEKLVPIYPLTEGITATQMRSMIAFALKNVSNLKENLPIEILIRENFPDKLLAIKTLHNPKNYKEKETARKRLAFEELFFMQAGILMLKEKRKINSYGIKCGPSGKLVKSVLNKFPFELTKDQKKAFSDIENDMEDIEPMYRLLQGDGGSGKTAIAALTAAKIVENGYQATIMAPTEVLASQHYKTFLNLYKNLSVEIAYLSGNIKNSEREVLLNKLKSGEIDILIGTHALIENNVKFAHLGLVITDEQHRFGVKQRELLETKGENPHVLVMTATPIPRTMALSVYGDLDASVINQMPIGRKPVKTYVINDKLLQRVLIFIKKEIQKGHQAYIVCPLVEESEKTDLAAAISVYDKLRKNIFSEYKCGLIYGKMKNSEKEQIMNDFCENRLQILV